VTITDRTLFLTVFFKSEIETWNFRFGLSSFFITFITGQSSSASLSTSGLIGHPKTIKTTVTIAKMALGSNSGKLLESEAMDIHRPSIRLADLIRRFESKAITVNDGRTAATAIVHSQKLVSTPPTNSTAHPKRLQQRHNRLPTHANVVDKGNRTSWTVQQKQAESSLAGGYSKLNGSTDVTRSTSNSSQSNAIEPLSDSPFEIALEQHERDSFPVSSSRSANVYQTTRQQQLITVSILLPSQVRPIPYSTVTQRMLRLLAGNTWFTSGRKHRCLMLRTLEKGG
jgi:hypothetical protein